MSELTVHLTGLAAELAPVRARPTRHWWRDDLRTSGHAVHCLPLTMANSLGWYVLSPGDFRVTWDGDWDADAHVEKLEPDCEPFVVTTHSAGATFTVQPGFIPVTDEEGDFVLIGPIANCRGAWFSAMAALIEAWWQPGEFGIVCMLNRPGNFVVRRGEPIAQMAVYKAEAGFAGLRVEDAMPPGTPAWLARRTRPGYRKDLDYLHGRHPNGTPERSHLRSWHRVSSTATA